MHHFFETHQLKAHIPADSEAGAVNTGWIQWGQFHELVGLLSVGDMVATATLDLAVEQATSSGGAGAKALTKKDGTNLTITQLTQAGGDSNKAVGFTALAEYLDVNNGFEYVRVTITPATAAVEFAFFLFGVEPRYAPVSTSNFDEVVGP
jgi:hypothetical protein